jgi:N-acetylmuramoyl-L-alanine amidase
MKENTGLKQAFLLFIIFTSLTFAQGGTKFKVVLDPGHGGKDFGAIYNGFVEKNIALNVALKVGKLLEADPNVDVVYTRRNDAFVDMEERAGIANKASGDVFVSFHCNAESKKVASGTETYFAGATKNIASIEVAKRENSVLTLEKDYKTHYEGFDPNNPEVIAGAMALQEAVQNKSIDLAGKIQEGFLEIKRKSRGVKQGPFWLLNNVAMPGVLIEMGFLSSADEGLYVNSDFGQDELAKSIAASILSYKKELVTGGGSEPAQTVATNTPKPKPEAPKAEKAETKPEPVVKNEPAKQEAVAPVGDVVFKIQIAASSKDLALQPANFKGLEDVSKDNSSSVIKYFYGATAEYEKAKELLAVAKGKGYESAFVVAFRGGKKITIQEALNKR